jgi:hypothetical protein
LNLFVIEVIIRLITGCTYCEGGNCQSTNLPLSSTQVGTAQEVQEENTIELSPTFGNSNSEIRSLLLDGETCKTTCFLGIEPNITTLQEAKNIFAKLKIQLELGDHNQNLEIYEATLVLENSSYIYVLVYVTNGLVVGIKPHIEQSDKNSTFSGNLNDYLEFSDIWYAYSIKRIFEYYGIPGDIRISMDSTNKDTDNDNTILYSLYIYYPSKDLILQYDLFTEKTGDTVLLCPITDKFIGLSMWMGDNPQNPPYLESPFSTITGVSIDSFFELIKSTNKRQCIDILQ